MRGPTNEDEAQRRSAGGGLRLYCMEAGGGTTRYFVEARPPAGGRVRLVAPEGFVVTSWSADAGGAIHGQWISPFPDLFAVIDVLGNELCRADAEPAGVEHRSVVG